MTIKQLYTDTVQCVKIKSMICMKAFTELFDFKEYSEDSKFHNAANEEMIRNIKC